MNTNRKNPGALSAKEVERLLDSSLSNLVPLQRHFSVTDNKLYAMIISDAWKKLYDLRTALQPFV